MVSGKGITYIAVNINHLQIIAHRTSNFNIINNCPEKQGNKFFNCPISVYFARPNHFVKTVKNGTDKSIYPRFSQRSEI